MRQAGSGSSHEQGGRDGEPKSTGFDSAAERLLQRASARSGVYRLLAQVYLREVDQALLGVLRSHEALAATLPLGDDSALLGTLRAEYARLFLLNVYPYESAFVDGEALLNTAATRAVVAAYAGAGFDPDPPRRVGSPDHIGIELEFVAQLIAAGAAAMDRGDTETATDRRDREVAFLSQHLASWGPVFDLAVERNARVAFYREIGRFTAEFLIADLDGLSTADPVRRRSPGGRTPGSQVSGAEALDSPSVLGEDLREIARRLTTPAAVGFHLSREELFRMAGELDLPLAPVERWLMLEQLFHAAARYGVVQGLLERLRAQASRAEERYTSWLATYPNAAGVVEPWRRRARSAALAIRGMEAAAGSASSWPRS